MAFENYDFQRNPESFIENINCKDHAMPETENRVCCDVEIIEKDHDNSWNESFNLSSSVEDSEKKMALENYDFQRNPEDFMENINLKDHAMPVTENKGCSGVEIIEKDHEDAWNDSFNVSSSIEEAEKKPEVLIKSLSPSSVTPVTVKGDIQDNLNQADLPLIHTVNNIEEPPKGRARLVRLQAACGATQPKTGGEESQDVDTATPCSDESKHQSSRSSDAPMKASWTSASTTSTLPDLTKGLVHDSFSPSLKKTPESSDRMSSSNSDEIPSLDAMQRILTADGQYVYNYKDSRGEVHFFYPTISDRESHNEKERKRRSRVSDACSALRKLIPGLNEKTDKASVFEQTARYLRFIRDKYDVQFDQAFCERYSPGRN